MGYNDNRLDLTGIGHVDGSFIGGEFIIATPEGEIRHAAADVVSIQLREEEIVAEGVIKAAPQPISTTAVITNETQSDLPVSSATNSRTPALEKVLRQLSTREVETEIRSSERA